MDYTNITSYKTKTGEVVGFSTTSKTVTLPETFTKVDDEVGYKQFPEIKKQKEAIEKLKEQLAKQ